MSNQTRVAFVGGALIDGTGKDTLQDAAVVVNGTTIQEVGKKAHVQIPADCTVVDVSGKTVMPGMFDCHVHVGVHAQDTDTVLFTHKTVTTFQTAAVLKRTLHAGFTTIRDAGGIDVGFRSAAETGLIESPRLVVSGLIGQTGGHFDAYYPVGVELETLDIKMCDGVPDVQKAARQVLREGYDFIKICSTGGVLSPTDTPDCTEWTMEELKAMVYEASARGKAVMSHAQGLQGIKNALMGGVWSVEHGCKLDDEAIQLFLDTGTYLVPTLFIVDHLFEHGEEMGIAPTMLAKLDLIRHDHAKSFRKAAAAGVRIGMGTDIVDDGAHGKNARELELMVRHGFTPMQAIVAATKTSAEVCRIENKVGTIEGGKLADLLIVDGNPLDDITILQDQACLLMVMKEGKRYVDRL